MTDKKDLPKPMTRTQLRAALAVKTGLTGNQCGEVLEALAEIAVTELHKPDIGQFTVPDLVTINLKQKPATPERPGVNPFTKEAITIKAKPAKNVVKFKPVKALKDKVS